MALSPLINAPISRQDTVIEIVRKGDGTSMWSALESVKTGEAAAGIARRKRLADRQRRRWGRGGPFAKACWSRP